MLTVGIRTCLYWIFFFNLEWGVNDFLGWWVFLLPFVSFLFFVGPSHYTSSILLGRFWCILFVINILCLFTQIKYIYVKL